MAALAEKPSSARHTDATSLAVDLGLLMESPEAALLPVLRLLPGPWASATLEELSVNAMSGALSEWRQGRRAAESGAADAARHTTQRDAAPGFFSATCPCLPACMPTPCPPPAVHSQPRVPLRPRARGR